MKLTLKATATLVGFPLLAMVCCTFLADNAVAQSTAAQRAFAARRPLARGGGGTIGPLASNGMVVVPANAATLAAALLGAGVTLSGTPTLTGAAAQAGTFTNAPGLVGFPSGIVLSSGNVSDAATTYAGADLPSTNEGGTGDSQLTALVGATTFDAATLTFSFIPSSSTIFFSYTFASAEYPNFVGSQFNDVFAFFVNGTNRALLPGTSTVVSINNVNTTTNSQFFNKYNTTGDALSYGGETRVLTVTAPVNSGQVNTIKIAIADTSDGVLDSAIFIANGSFSTAPPPTPGVPVPPSLILTMIGLAGLGTYMALRQRRARA